MRRAALSPAPVLLTLATFLAVGCDGDRAPTLALARGPYLQVGTPTSVVVRWRTTLPTDSVVRYGVQGESSGQVQLTDSVTEHEVTIAGLEPATTYHYVVGSTAGPLPGAKAEGVFMTAPAVGSPAPVRAWVLGDAGTANANQRAVRDGYARFAGGRQADLVLLLGDNAYYVGSDREYQRALFDTYPTFLRTTVFWPTIGNHDTAFSANPPASLPYLQMFTLPQQGEAGGVASGTERYYSFEHGDVHFVCLDSMASDRAPGGAMLTWLRADLAANTRRYLIAFWHHPPYSKGSHDSDTELELVEMRSGAVPLLEAGGVDLVLAGHSHGYERSFLLAGHHGPSATFSEGHRRAPGNGRPDGDGAYRKGLAGPAAVYVVAGSSGQVTPGTFDHPAMQVSLGQLGSLVVDAARERLDVRFVRETGAVADHFAIVKQP